MTLSLAAVRRHPWRKVAHYILAQYLGAFLGAALVFATYYEAQMEADPDFGVATTAGIYATYKKGYLSLGGGFMDQVRRNGRN